MSAVQLIIQLQSDHQVTLKASIEQLATKVEGFGARVQTAVDVNHVEEAVKVSVESSLAPFQVKFTELSNLCHNIAEALKPSSTSMSRVMVKDDADDKVDKVDRSRNVIIFGIDEVTDTTDGTAWRDTVVQTLSTAAGRDVVIEYAFRLGRTVTTGRKRPVLVRLHSAWDRRIILSGSWKLSRKAGFESIFIAPDEQVEIRRQKICDRLVKRATTRGQSQAMGQIWSTCTPPPHLYQTRFF